jgi:hypothetical protein
VNASQHATGRPESRAFVSGLLELGSGGLARLEGLGRDFLFTAERGAGVVPCARSGAGPGRCRLVMLGGSRGEVLRAFGELQTWCRRGLR